jgi:hypothetical protein
MSGTGNAFTMDIAVRQGTHTPAPRSYLLKAHRWPGHSNYPTLNGSPIIEYSTWSAFEAAGQGYFFDTAADILYVKFADTGADLTFTFGGPQIPDVPGDFNSDGDVDQEDFGHLQACLTGTGVPVSDPDCFDADLDEDGPIGSGDVSIFLDCMTGANIVGDPSCAD